MVRTRRIVASGLLAIVTVFAAGQASAAGVVWETSARQAQHYSRISGRPLLIYVGAGFCGYCRKMERTTWSDAVVATSVRRTFVPLKIDAQQSPQIARQLNVRAYPTTILLGPDGALLARQDGYVDPRTMLNFLRRSPLSAK